MTNDSRIEQLVRQASEKTAREELAEILTPMIERDVVRATHSRNRSSLESEWGRIAQETWIKIERKLPTFEWNGIAPFRTWMKIVARHTVCDHVELREFIRRITLSPRGSDDRIRHMIDFEVSSERQASSIARRNETVVRAREAMEGLPDTQRVALELWIDGLGWTEIGKKLGITPPSAMMRVERARVAIRKAIGGLSRNTRG